MIGGGPERITPKEEIKEDLNLMMASQPLMV
jgi:hypothetical protein